MPAKSTHKSTRPPGSRFGSLRSDSTGRQNYIDKAIELAANDLAYSHIEVHVVTKCHRMYSVVHSADAMIYFLLQSVPGFVLLSGQPGTCLWNHNGPDPLAQIESYFRDPIAVASLVPMNLKITTTRSSHYGPEYLHQYACLHWFLSNWRNRDRYHLPDGLAHDDAIVRHIESIGTPTP